MFLDAFSVCMGCLPVLMKQIGFFFEIFREFIATGLTCLTAHLGQGLAPPKTGHHRTTAPMASTTPTPKRKLNRPNSWMFDAVVILRRHTCRCNRAVERDPTL